MSEIHRRTVGNKKKLIWNGKQIGTSPHKNKRTREKAWAIWKIKYLIKEWNDGNNSWAEKTNLRLSEKRKLIDVPKFDIN